MSLNNLDAEKSLGLFQDMFSKDVFIPRGDLRWHLQTQSLCSVGYFFDGQDDQQWCPQPIVSNSPGSPSQSQAYIHLSTRLLATTSKNLSYANVAYEQEQMFEKPIAVQEDDEILPYRFNIQRQNYQFLTPYKTLEPQEMQNLSFGTSRMISQFISKEQYQGPQKSQCNLESSAKFSKNLLISTSKNHQSNLSNLKQKKGRKNDQNNSDKKLIMVLHSALSDSQKGKLKARINQCQQKYGIKLKTALSSRYGFIQELVTLRHFFGAKFMQNLFAKFQIKLTKFAQIIGNHPKSQSNDYLLKLPRFYIKSFESFLNGSIRGSIEQLYAMVPGFKQKKYMLQGIQKVQKLERDLMSLKK